MMKMHVVITAALATVLASGAAGAQQASATPTATAAPDRAAGMFARADGDGDGFVSKQEAASMPRLAERFDSLDKDGDGRLSQAEMPAARRGARAQQAGAHRGMQGRHGMKAMDANGDGSISREEATAAGMSADRFAQSDANKDGRLDRADLQARMAERRSECFAKADTDRNGQLSRAEFDRMHEVCGTARRGMRRGHAAAPQAPKP